MNSNEFFVKGFKVTIIKKSNYDAIGYSRPVNLDCGDIGKFLDELTKSGKINKLAATVDHPQQIWVCLSGGSCSDENKMCKICDASCAGFHTRCTVCVERTDKHNFSSFYEGELFTLNIPASEWALYEVNEKQDPSELHKFGVYDMVKDIGYEWNKKIPGHFDNEHEWESGKKMYFLLPIISINNK